MQSNCERNPHVKKSLRFNPTWVLPVSPWAHHVVGPPVGAHRLGPRSSVGRTVVLSARSRTCRGRGGRVVVRMARACVHSSVSGESSQCSRFVECLTDCIVRRWRHDVRRHELGGGARAPRDDGQHPRRRRRHHLVHVPHQQRDPAAQVAPQTEVGRRRAEKRVACLAIFVANVINFFCPS